ncbi:HAMP domain-containing sensor histidine kinase [Bacillus sp. J37]|uniref:sensor histidine kinase n=1 Tax=Bacillus sp. J37 TaxID=935837 RepID=UPI0004B21B30|nr:HAMP domain-containing sensor histidine kinase [Bacillus sp. J37]
MDLVKDIILQTTFVILPIFIFHLFWLSRNDLNALKTNIPLITFGCMISSILCIIAPIEIIDGLYFNLHTIPLFISFVYGGYISGFITLLSTIAYFVYPYEYSLFYLGISILVYGIISLSIRNRWLTYTLKKKFLYTLLYGASILTFTLLVFLFVSVSKIESVHFQQIILVGVSIFILTLMLVLSVYLVEYMRATAVLRLELVKAEKLSIVSELAASVAHEVRNPLTVVRGFVQLIGNSTDSTDNQRKEYMNLVLAELDRAQSIITDYLGMAGQHKVQKEKINLTDTLNEITVLMTSYANFKTVRFNCDIEKNLYVFGDRSKLKQVFINIIKNSIEAVPSINGIVSIKAEVKEELIYIKISDNGVGMTKEQIERLGEPYYSLKENGTGLGLTVTYSIINSHGGSVKYSSELNKGTIAIVRLPFYVNKSTTHPFEVHQNLG